MEAFVNEVLMAYGDWRFLILTTVLLVVGLIFLKGYKKRFVFPALILAGVILNPLFYTLWYKFNDRSYWRMMWMVPIIPVCVIVPAFFIEKCKKDIVKVGVLFLTTAVMILCGSFIYDGGREVFAAANNPEKLPDDVVAVGEALLDLDNHPTVVADGQISTYIRQYSGKIITPYARSATWGQPSGVAGRIYADLSNRNMSELTNKMREYDYAYLVTQNQDDEKNSAIGNAGFEMIKQINGYGIYRVPENKNEIRTYNELHQTTSITITDSEGNPVNGEKGYSTIFYGHDDNGLKNYEFRVNTDGKGVADSNGRAGYRYTYNDNGMVVRQEYLDENCNLVPEGLAVITSEYDSRNLFRRD